MRHTILEHIIRELWAMRRILPHRDNNTVRKSVILGAIGVWVILELGTTFTQATPPTSMSWIRAFVLYVLGREVGFERTANGPPSPPTSRNGGGGGDGSGEN